MFPFILKMITMQRELWVVFSCKKSQSPRIYPGGAGKDGLWISHLGAKSPQFSESGRYGYLFKG
jgi:hypothetical protein